MMAAGKGKRPQDDLTVIPGIGKDRQRWLQEVFGVYTFRDLAALSVDEVEAHLKAEEDKKNFSLEDVERWIRAAQEKVDAGPQVVTTSPSTAAHATRSYQNNDPDRDGWDVFATFLVDFRTRLGAEGQQELRTVVSHMDEDKPKKLDGIALDEMKDWIAERIKVPVVDAVVAEEASPMPPPPPITAPPAAAPLNVAVEQVQCFQPSEAVQPVVTVREDGMLSGFLTADVPFRIMAVLRVDGADAPEFTSQPLSFDAEFSAQRFASRVDIPLGEAKPGVITDTTCQMCVDEATLPVGDYTLRIIARVSDTQRLLGYREQRLLQVV